MLLRAINGALGQVQAGLHADEIRDERDPRGFLLEFRMPLGAERFVQKLEDRRKHIELLSVSDRGADGLSAAVYVPMQSREYFLRKIEKYRDEETQKGRPKNESLVARVDRIVSGAFDSVFTDELDSLPEVTQSIWWEVWLRLGQSPAFAASAERHRVRVSAENLSFPEREVILAFGTQSDIGRCIIESGAVAEVRIAKDAPSIFLTVPNDEQQEWANDVMGRLVPPRPDAVAVCILDSGVTRQHVLIEPASKRQTCIDMIRTGQTVIALLGEVTARQWRD
jgi:hypothetical protein